MLTIVKIISEFEGGSWTNKFKKNERFIYTEGNKTFDHNELQQTEANKRKFS